MNSCDFNMVLTWFNIIQHDLTWFNMILHIWYGCHKWGDIEITSNNINGFQTKTYDKQNFDCLLEYNRVLEEECKTLDLERRDEKLYIYFWYL